ncbi:hypothetical protein [Chondromyces crocatus]|uniref:Lipoprotein n=1 Tax=Chondromyces crocatus TaxID=52 RepID=A0A0K1EI11_CHOCO|nr:hypothetical protein [Chondromyces crocatus]AKT40218.1 uncharacterized protein CMC5_043710 [Chondromyces crocatus]
MRTLSLFLLLLPALTGCEHLFGKAEPEEPGEVLGVFHVVGTRASNTCGEGALGATPTWEFDVELSREEGILYWNNGAELVLGSLADDDRTFSIEASSVVDMRTEETLAYAPCSLERRDIASGKLQKAGEDEIVPGFSGSLTYRFSPTADSECMDLIEGETALFTMLPCTMVYELAAVRLAASESE